MKISISKNIFGFNLKLFGYTMNNGEYELNRKRKQYKNARTFVWKPVVCASHLLTIN